MQISLKRGCIYSATAAKALRMKGNRNYCLRLTFFLLLGLFSYRHGFKIIIWFCFEKRQSYINASNLVAWQCFFFYRWMVIMDEIAREWEDGSFKPKLHGRLQASLILKLMTETRQKSWSNGVLTIVLRHLFINKPLERFGREDSNIRHFKNGILPSFCSICDFISSTERGLHFSTCSGSCDDIVGWKIPQFFMKRLQVIIWQF